MIPRECLQWLRASVGSSVRLVPVAEVAHLRSGEKYTLVAWTGAEALIRRTIRELADELDPQVFVQVRRSAIVNLHLVAQVVRGDNDTATLHLRGRAEPLPVSRSWLHLFRQMQVERSLSLPAVRATARPRRERRTNRRAGSARAGCVSRPGRRR